MAAREQSAPTADSPAPARVISDRSLSPDANRSDQPPEPPKRYQAQARPKELTTVLLFLRMNYCFHEQRLSSVY